MTQLVGKISIPDVAHKPLTGNDIHELLNNPQSEYAKAYKAACDANIAETNLLAEEDYLHYVAALRERALEDAQYEQDARHMDEKIKRLAIQAATRKPSYRPLEEELLVDFANNKREEAVNAILKHLFAKVGELNAVQAEMAKAHVAAQAETTAILAAHQTAVHQAAQAYHQALLTMTEPMLTPEEQQEIPLVVHATPAQLMMQLPADHDTARHYNQQVTLTTQQNLEKGMSIEKAEADARIDTLEKMNAYHHYDRNFEIEFIRVIDLFSKKAKTEPKNSKYDPFRELTIGKKAHYASDFTAQLRLQMGSTARHQDEEMVTRLANIMSVKRRIEAKQRQIQEDLLAVLTQLIVQKQLKSNSVTSVGIYQNKAKAAQQQAQDDLLNQQINMTLRRTTAVTS